jgi:hypothetical protein
MMFLEPPADPFFFKAASPQKVKNIEVWSPAAAAPVASTNAARTLSRSPLKTMIVAASSTVRSRTSASLRSISSRKTLSCRSTSAATAPWISVGAIGAFTFIQSSWRMAQAYIM